MAFILKTDPTVINIKLTDKGRQLLASGQLTFSKYALGDSEIDYGFNKEISLNTFEQKILRPKDNNPNIVNFLEETVSGATMLDLPTVVANTSLISNTVQERGFFSTGTTGYDLNLDTTYVKNAFGIVDIGSVIGGTQLLINQSPDYVSGSTEPEIGDYTLIKWANPYLTGTTTNDTDEAIPYIWYKIEDIISGSLSTDDLLVNVDKELPDFNGNGGGVYSLALIYPNSNSREVSGDSIQQYYGKPYTTDFLDAAMLSFLENWDLGLENEDVPVWNMSIIFTEEVAGVDLTIDRNYSQYYTKDLGGFVRYIQQTDPHIDKIGVVHYTNLIPKNTYGEGLITGGTNIILELPTIMWHKNEDGVMGLTLSASGTQQTLDGLNTNYFDLVDDYGNVVGKVFTELKVFVIEDQELLFAMSYKANRSWTLPEFTAALNISLCPESDIEVIIL